MEVYDFSGYATKNDLRCSDGRTIKKDAFKHNDGATVPLVWQHVHTEPNNVLGHALLENREDGVYAYCKFNSTPSGKNAKELVEHGDINALSIYANQLIQKGGDVVHGEIKEVSLVLAGANPGALIDNLSIAHADGSYTESEDEAIIYTGAKISLKVEESANEIEHAESKGKTVADVFNAMTDEQKEAVYSMIADVIKESGEVKHSDEGGNEEMKKNVFEGKEAVTQPTSLTHSQFAEIVSDAQKCGSFKEAFLSHTQTYGIENIDMLFPDAKNVTNPPTFIKRDTDWVAGVLSGTKHTPFSRIKSMAADITADEARARGYIKGKLKKEEVIRLLKRVTTPTTIYKKQKLDRDDIIDITDLDVVAWLKSEMRIMLDEEIARAILVGDGRDPESDDKINEENIRPIYSDNELYSYKVEIDSNASNWREGILRAMVDYKGSGSPTLYTTSANLIELRLLTDGFNRPLYRTDAEIASALGVSNIVTVPVMENISRKITTGEGTSAKTQTLNLFGIIVNLKDYTVGADKGGQISMFDDFDIDYNQYKYLMETRISGCLINPKSAVVLEIDPSTAAVG